MLNKQTSKQTGILSRLGFLPQRGFNVGLKAQPTLHFSPLTSHLSLRPAFTLAETLITLGIIGVVAAIVIPAVMNNINSKEVYTRLVKTQSTLQNAVNRTMQEYGCIGDLSCTGLFATGNNAVAAIYALNGITEAELNSGVTPKGITQFLNVVKNCGRGTGCFPALTYPTLGGKTDVGYLNLDSDTTYYSKVIISDGTLISLSVNASNNCTRDVGDGPMGEVCGYFSIDINGFKSPNVYGRDLFVFWLGKNGVVYPGGNKYLTNYNYPGFCNVNNSTTGDNGIACTAHVLDIGGIDY